MRVIGIILILLAIAGVPLAGVSAETPAEHVTAAAHGEAAAHAEHGLTSGAVELWKPFGFPITNSMIVTWAVALGLIIFAQIATRNMTMVPEGAQNFIEWLV